MKQGMIRWQVAAIFMLAAMVACSRQGDVEAVKPAAVTVEPSPVIIITSEADFATLVEQSDLPVLVDFWATWCPPCRAMEPIIKTTAGRHQNAIKVAKVDVDQNRALAEKFQIRSIPTLMLYRDGRAISQHIGGLREAELDTWIKQELGTGTGSTTPATL